MHIIILYLHVLFFYDLKLLHREQVNALLHFVLAYRSNVAFYGELETFYGKASKCTASFCTCQWILM